MRFRIIFGAFTNPNPAVQVRHQKWLEAEDRPAAQAEVRRIRDECRLDRVGFQLDAINIDPHNDGPSFEEWARALGGQS